jgi:hypothetical protein
MKRLTPLHHFGELVMGFNFFGVFNRQRGSFFAVIV